VAVAKIPLRNWATPLTIGAFILMAGTGSVMFFKFDNGLMAPAHRLFSWVFLLGAINHILANVRSFTNHLKSTLGRISAITFVSILLASCFSWGQVTSPKVIIPVEAALVAAPLGAVAALQRTSPDVLVGRLAEQGVIGTPNQSVLEIAAANHIREDRLLGMIFLPRQDRGVR
jgi:hypothetical protein